MKQTKRTLLIIAVTLLVILSSGIVLNISRVLAEDNPIINGYPEAENDDMKFTWGEAWQSFFGGIGGGSGTGSGFEKFVGEDIEKNLPIFCNEEGIISAYKDYEANPGSYIAGSVIKDQMITDKLGEKWNAFEQGLTSIRTQPLGSSLNEDVSKNNSIFIVGDRYVTPNNITGKTPKTLNDEESYLFATPALTLATKEQFQKAYWQLPGGGTTNGGSISGDTIGILVEEAATYRNYRSQGVKPLNINNHNATVSYSFTDKEFLIGPFSLSYTRFFFKVNGPRIRTEQIGIAYKDGKIDYAGLLWMKATLDNGKTITLKDNNFVYTNSKSSLHSVDTGYQYPYEEDGQFYIKLSMDEVGDAHTIENISARYRTVSASKGTALQIDNMYSEAQIVDVSVTPTKICPGGHLGECGSKGEHGAHTFLSHEFTGKYQWKKDDKGKWFKDYEMIWVNKSCEGTWYCEHGKLDKCDIVLEVRDFVSKTNVISLNTPGQQLLALVGVASEVYFRESLGKVELDLPLRMNYGGIVWEDEHTGKMQDQDGQIGYNPNGVRTEKGVKNVKVTIYNKETNKPYGSTYTDENGRYLFEQIEMGQYYAIFDYDGQTWEPTAYFVGGEDKFATNSKAQENDDERIAFNNKFKEIIEGGALSSSGKLQNIQYDTQTSGKSFALTNEDGKVEGDYYSFFKMTSKTMDSDNNVISYPRENEVHIEDWNKSILNTTYIALYPEIEQINLGLVRRSASDFEVRKDVYKAIIQVNGKTEEYTYSSRDNITESFDVEVKTGPDYSNLEYNRAVFRSDYNYRISDYAEGAQLNKDSKTNTVEASVVDEMVNAITSNKGANSELKVYIIYKITIANRSNFYTGTVNELVDYYDEEYSYTGESWHGTPTSKENAIVWQTSPKYNEAKEFEGYDTLYTQTTSDIMLKSGQMLDIYMKFEVKKHTDEKGKNDSIWLDENAVTEEALGGKNNVVEITNYSTFKPDTTVEGKNIPANVEGKIEKDSHPGNANPLDKNTFEDDTDGAPRMNIILHKSEERSVYGYVWDDSRTEKLSNGQIVGNGLREDNEPLINGVVVQLIEKVEIDGKTYEYIWREMESGDNKMKYLDYDGKLVTGASLVDVGANDPNKEPANGKYFFNKYIPGNYIVRFIYGDNTSTIQTKVNGGKNDISYNGQDYKSTVYKAEEIAIDLNGNGQVNASEERFYNLENNLPNASKARDNAIRRLNVNKYSETMNNDIGNVLAAPYKTPDNGELIQKLRDNTWMYADTAIINATVGYNTADGANKGANIGYTNDLGQSQTATPVYKVENVGFGIEERPRTNIVLTKQIENVVITLSNGTILVDTANGIKNGVKIVPNKYSNSEQGKTNRIGLWSFEIDDELIQGSELKIYYRFTVENNGQIDTVGEGYNLDAIPTDLKQAEDMLGNAYYYGNTNGTKLVTTTIDKILDYVDRSIVFNPENNSGVWYDVEKMDDLKQAGLVDKSINITGNTSNNTMAMTEALKDNKLNPANNPKTDIVLVLTKILGGNSADYDYTFGNIAEIIQITNTVGRRDPDQIPGNQNPNDINKHENTSRSPYLENDADISEEFTITTPTGLDENMIYYIVAAVAAVVFAGGIILIKKFAIKKQ